MRYVQAFFCDGRGGVRTRYDEYQRNTEITLVCAHGESMRCFPDQELANAPGQEQHTLYPWRAVCDYIRTWAAQATAGYGCECWGLLPEHEFHFGPYTAMGESLRALLVEHGEGELDGKSVYIS